MRSKYMNEKDVKFVTLDVMMTFVSQSDLDNDVTRRLYITNKEVTFADDGVHVTFIICVPKSVIKCNQTLLCRPVVTDGRERMELVPFVVYGGHTAEAIFKRNALSGTDAQWLDANGKASLADGCATYRTFFPTMEWMRNARIEMESTLVSSHNAIYNFTDVVVKNIASGHIA